MTRSEDMENYDEGKNLSGADLRGANLSGADLRGANLSGADLRWANMRWANMRWANLSGANLSGANLRWADLSRADLSRANLRDIKEDFLSIIRNSNEVDYLATALAEGRVDGSVYEGPCACLVGTIANSKKCNYQEIPGLTPDSSRPAERWFLAISQGDKPETNPVVAITLEWIRAFRQEANEHSRSRIPTSTHQHRCKRCRLMFGCPRLRSTRHFPVFCVGCHTPEPKGRNT